MRIPLEKEQRDVEASKIEPGLINYQGHTTESRNFMLEVFGTLMYCIGNYIPTKIHTYLDPHLREIG